MHQVLQLDPRAGLVVRPLLQLMQQLSGVETTFLTLIDLDGQRQDVAFALNTGGLEVAEGTRVDWLDPWCRRAFLGGKPCSVDVAADFPDSPVAARSGIRTFFAVPLTSGARLVGSLCGASSRRRPVGADVLRMMSPIAQAVTSQLRPVARANGAGGRQAPAESPVAVPRPCGATHALTGLLDRAAFLARFGQACAHAARDDEELAVLVLDVDRFSAVNDMHGREAGDRVLQALASTLGAVARADDVAACLGGDRFALVLTRLRDVDPAQTAARIRSTFTRTCAVLGMTVSVGIGVACSRDTARAGLLRAAGRRLLQGKRAGRRPGAAAP